jgi:geranylgeranylglycerol-phosphate geranylgeranyltransferase
VDVVLLHAASKLLNKQPDNRRVYLRWVYLSGLAAILMVIAMRLAFG